MDAMSSSFLTNSFCHPKSILSSPPPTLLFSISSSLTIQEGKPRQDQRSPPQYEQTLGNTSPKATTTYSPPPPKPTLKRSRQSTSPPLTPASILFNALDDLVNNFIDPPLRPSVDPKHVLSSNFAPVDELPPTDCPIIEGTLPPCLDGAYIRNGPNPQHLPRGPYHLFDGDGMLHALRISNGRATLCSRYVKTYKYNVELEAGSPVFPNVFSGFNGLPAMAARGALSAARMLSGQFNPTNGIGLANTSLAFFGGKLFALGESDLPYQIRLTRDGDIETIGRHDFGGKFSSMSSMTAHPKVDGQTGETFAFRYSPMPPFLTYFRFDANGSKQPDVPVYSLTTPAFLHDFAITKKYAIFADIQIGMTTNPMELILGSGSVVGADSKKVPRIGVIPRYATDESEMKWYDVPGFNIVHAINAWDDEDDSIVLIAPNILSVEHTLERMELIHASVEKVIINLKDGAVTRSPISTKNLDFGVINQNFLGKKNKYGYAAIGDPMPKISGVVKLDWSSRGGREVGCRMFGEGCYAGEPFFVPKRAEQQDGVEEEEDDGYLVTYVHDENSGESRFLVMDAKSPTLEIVASVKLPRRVPYGFHGLFIRESDLKKL